MGEGRMMDVFDILSVHAEQFVGSTAHKRVSVRHPG